ncbi:MAG: 30S ribosomal protein S17 [Candidatus Aminicenantes bacterium]|nr:30S ribosomal protein S17 [Candidatus Aminicenantes bacterium]
MEKKTKSGITLTGQVVSTKADKTISVSVETVFQHPVYKKIIRKKKKYLAHDETNKFKEGDVVKIKLVRPLSKLKTWLAIELISSAPGKEVLK